MNDSEELRRIALMLLSNLRGAELELLAYKFVLKSIVQHRGMQQMDTFLDEARRNPDLQKRIQERYERLERGLRQFGKTRADELFLKALKEWKPSDPVN